MKILPLLLLPLFLVGCTSLTSSRGEQHQRELALHKVRTEVDEIKHDLNTYEIEHHVLEGKLIDIEQTMSTMRQQMGELKSGKLDLFMQELQNLEKKLYQVSKKQEKIASDMRQLTSFSNDATTALAHYKEKFTQFEKAIDAQNVQIQKLTGIKEEIEKIASEQASKSYTVKSGDSLEKIAREHHTSVEEIKRLNDISSDKIRVDQKLLIP